jgi:hypothetical protein
MPTEEVWGGLVQGFSIVWQSHFVQRVLARISPVAVELFEQNRMADLLTTGDLDHGCPSVAPRAGSFATLSTPLVPERPP